MNALLILALLAFTIVFPQQARSSDQSPPEQNTYSVAARGTNHRVWQRVTLHTNELGQVRGVTNSYSELETGMHYQENGEWNESKAEIKLDPRGAVAEEGRHKVVFSPNINVAGAIDLSTADGKRFRSHVLGLSYYDVATGQSVLIAEVKDSIGELLPPNQVIYADAFTDFKADILYTYMKSGFEQDIVFRERPPMPADFGLNPETTRLQVLTEFLDPPIPQIEREVVDNVQVDKVLSFGEMKIDQGRAFAEGENQTSIRVYKHWKKLEGRDFLIEEVKAKLIEPQLRALPLPPQAAVPPKGAADSIRHIVSNKRLLPEKRVVKVATTNAIQVASSPLEQNGFVIDYALLSSATNFVFKSDTTYFVAGPVLLSGTTTIEGGTVIKFTNNTAAKITVGDLRCYTDSYRPVIFTSMHDDSVGEILSGSNGNPWTNYCGSGIYLTSDGSSITNARFSFLDTALSLDGEGFTQNARNLQFVRCKKGIFLWSGDSGMTLNLNNTLFYSVGTAIESDALEAVLRMSHITANQCTNFTSTHDGHLYITNSLLVAVTNFANASVSVVSSNQLVILTNGAGIFQTAGAGEHYLAEESIYRNVGTTNLSADLLADLRKKTTYPPIIWADPEDYITEDTTLEPQALRDTDQPDLGYHYDPLDYVVSRKPISDETTLTLTNGIALGFYGFDYGGLHFVSSALRSVGSPTNLNRFAWYNTVQEQANTNWSDRNNSGFFVDADGPDDIQCRFTDFSIMASDFNPMPYSVDGYTGTFQFRDCQFRGGNTMWFVTIYGGLSVSLTNCLFERNCILAGSYGYGPVEIHAFNNLFLGGAIYLEGAIDPYQYTFKDNLFDHTLIPWSDITVTNNHNAYITNEDQFWSGTNDIILSNSPAYQAGILGRYYYPTNFPLINAGSRSAANARLYHYTTTTNQIKETNSTVDIGFHYVAIGTNGAPMDWDADGVPDYREDADGDGCEEPRITLQPTNQIVLQGSNVTFSAGADGASTLRFQWFYNVTNSISGATNASLTLTNVQLSQEGYYSLRATNTCGEILSSNAFLTIITPPIFTLQPGNCTVNVTSNATFSVSMSSNSATPLYYQWLHNGNTLAGATNSSLTVTNVQITNVGYYSVVVTNSAGTNLSTPGALTVTILATNFTNSTALRTNGSTIFTNTTDGRVLQLTPALTNMDGSAFSMVPISLVSNASFSTAFSFRMDKANGKTNASADNHTGGEGFVFVVQTLTNNAIGVSGSMGYFKITNSMGIEFDTWANTCDDPGLCDEYLGSGRDGNHVGIDYNGFLTNVSGVLQTNGSSITSIHVTNDLNNTNIWYAWVDYNGTNLEVRLSETNNSRPISPILTNAVNLPSYLLTSNAYIGFTAGTGHALNEQNILSWQFISPYRPIGAPNPVPVVTINSPTNSATFTYGTAIALQATASEQGGTITNVQFYNWTTNLLGMATAGVSNSFTLAWTNAAVGSNMLTAVATDNFGISSTSSPVLINIQDGLAIQIVSPTNGQTLLARSNILIQAVTETSGETVSWVHFFSGTNSLGYGLALTNGFYQVNWAPLTGGVYVLTAEVFDSLGSNALSAGVTVTVRDLPNVTITTPVDIAVLGPSVLNVPVSATASVSGATITNLVIYQGTNILGSTNSSACSITWSNVSEGTYTLKAKATDNTGAVGLSGVISIQVIATNGPPTVYAGTDQTNRLPASTYLEGTVFDDGLPLTNSLSVGWTMFSGPPGATVTFSNTNQAATGAIFSHPGVYTNRLQASDGQYTNTDDVVITILNTNAAPNVTTGTNQMVTLAARYQVSASVLNGASLQSVRSSRGKEFWLGFPENIASAADPLTLALFITSENYASGSISVPGIGYYTNFICSPGMGARIDLDPSVQVESNCQIENKGIHIMSDAQISVHGLTRRNTIADEFLGLPVNSLGTSYVVLSWEASYSDSELLVVGTEKNTAVSITPSFADTNYSIELGPGQTYQLKTSTGDPSGTIITADKPIAVFGAAACINIPSTNDACDALVEQLPPTDSWGKEFFTVPLTNRIFGDYFQIVSATNQTTVWTNGIFAAEIDKGEVCTFLLETSSKITSDKPILLAQYATGGSMYLSVGDPFIMLIPPFEQFLSSYTFTVITNYVETNFVNIVITNSAVSQVYLDGIVIDPTNFIPITNSSGFNYGFSGAQLLVEQATHRLSSPSPLGVSVYGWGDYESYGYPAGFSLGSIGNITGVSLNPSHVTNEFSTTSFIIAMVTNQNNQPVIGTRVDFQVSGANVFNGFSFTDESGEARFYYTGTNLGVDTIQATVGSHQATATNTWEMPSFTLHGFVSDDALPAGVTNIVWTQIGGPAITSFSSAASTNPVVYVNEEGLYVFRLTADDTELTNFNETVVIVRRNHAPVVDTGSDITTKETSFSLNGTVSDDGLPSNVLTTIWSKISGSGAVAFANASNATTTVTFGTPGTYVLRLTGDDSQAVVSKDVTVSIQVDSQPVQCGNEINAALASTDSHSTEQTNNYADYYAFGGASNQILVVSMQSTNFDTRLIIRNQQLQKLIECDDYLDGTNSRVVYTLPADGDYTIEATSSGTVQTGNYSIQIGCGLAPEVCLTAPLQLTAYTNAPTNITVTAVAYDADGIDRVEFYEGNNLLDTVSSAPYSFLWSSVSAGNYTLTAVAYDTNLNASTSAPVSIVVGMPSLWITSSSNCSQLLLTTNTITATLKDGTGNPIAGTNIVFVVNGANPRTNTVATDGSGIAILMYQGTNYGLDEITANTTINGQAITANSLEQSWAMSVSCNQIINTSLSGFEGVSSRSGYADYYSFNGQSNDNVTLSLSSTNFDTFVVLRKENCDIVSTNDDQGGTTDSIISCTLPASGNYIIEVTSSLPNKTGAYALQLNCNSTNGLPEIGVLKAGQTVSNYATLDFGTTLTGTSTNVTLVITNSGDGPLTLASLGHSSGFTITTLPTSPIPAGSATSLTIRFDATSNGTASGILTFASNDADNGDGIESPFVLNLLAIANPSGTPPTVDLTSPTNNSAHAYEDLIPVAATASAAGGSTITNVNFFAVNGNGQRFFIGRSTSIPYTNALYRIEPGTYSIMAEATDSVGRRSQSVQTNIQIRLPNTNHPPVAITDRPTVRANSVNNIFDPLANDSDSDSDSLTITAYHLSSAPGSHGSVEIINSGKQIRYTPPADISSTDPITGITHSGDGFSYQISDGKGGTSWGSIYVYIYASAVPQVEIVSPPSPYSTNAGALMPITAEVTPFINVSTVEFFRGKTKIGVVTNGTSGSYTLNWIATTEDCDCGITATATDTFGQMGTSLPIYIDVIPPINGTNGTSIGPVATFDTYIGSGILTQLTNSIDDLGIASPVIIRDGIFDIFGRAYHPLGSNDLVWALGIYSSTGTLIRVLTNNTTSAGSSTTSNFLATCDFTMLENGPYDLRLTATAGYMTTNTSVRVILDSNLKIGQFSFSQQDLAIPVGGIPLTVTRTYNSLNPRRGDFGYGWTFALNSMDVTLDDERETFRIGDSQVLSADIEDAEDAREVNIRTGGGWNVTLTLPDGRRATFVFNPSVGVNTATAQWSAPIGVNAKLTPLGSHVINLLPCLFPPDCVPPFWQQGGDDSNLDNHDVPGWVLETEDKTQYYITREPDIDDANVVFDPFGIGDPVNVQAFGPPKLTQIIQPSGDIITINRDSIVHSTTNGETRRIVFQRNSDGLISAISDPNGLNPDGSTSGPPAVKYEYDSNQNLMSVLTLVDRNTPTYVTNSFGYTNRHFPHYITDISDPRGLTVAKNFYHDDGRLWKVVDADGKVTEFHHDLDRNTEIVVDRLGYTNSYVYDLRGNVLKTTNALGHITQMSYTANDLLESSMDALANTTLYFYDDKGHQTNITDALHTNTFSYSTNGNLLIQTDSMGNMTSNRYDSVGNLTNTVQLDSLGNILQQSFSIYENGHLVETRNGSNQLTASFEYDASGNLTNTADANGFERSFGYDQNGNQTNTSYVWVGPSSNVTVTTSTEYDAAGRVIRSIDANGNTNRTFYNSLGKVDYTIDKFGKTNSFLYDARGNLIQTITPFGTNQTVFDDNARPILATDRNGITATRTYYDALGRVTNTVRLTNATISIEILANNVGRSMVGSTGTAISTNLTEYYANGWVKSRTGTDGKTTSYGYYPDGQLKAVTNALTNVTSYVYDPAGRQKFAVDALNRTNQFEYDAVGRMTRTIFHDLSSVSNRFNSLGQRIAQVDQTNLVTEFGYNNAGQLTSVKKPTVFDPENGNQATNSVWTYDYDDYGRLTVLTDPKDRKTTNTFDELGRPKTRRLPMGQTETNFYNAFGQLYQKFDFKGQKTEFLYDGFGRTKAKFFFATGASTPTEGVCYQYNSLGQLWKIIERRGTGVTTNACDGYAALTGFGNDAPGSAPSFIGSLMRKSLPQTGWLLALSLFGLAMVMIPREAKKALAAFYLRGGWMLDDVARLSRLRIRAVSPQKLARWMPALWMRGMAVFLAVLMGTMEPGLQLMNTASASTCVIPASSTDDNERVTEFTYDLEGRLARVNSPEGVINYEYDLATGRHSRTCTANSETAYGYDDLGRLEIVTALKRHGTNINETTTYTYTAVGSRETVTLPNGVITTYQYDDLNRLTNLTHNAGGTNLLAQYTYGLHVTGRRTNAVEVTKREDNSYVTNTLSWAYDGMYRLTNEVSVSTLGASSTYTNQYLYDTVGNRLQKVRIQGASTTTVTSTFNDNDQLLSEITSGSLSATNNYGYDNNGSLIAKTNIASGGTTVTAYGYNLANKLSSVATGGTTNATYLYNDSGIRVRSTAGSITHYLVDANNHTGYAQVLEELSTVGGTPSKSYVIGDDMLAQSGSTTNASYLLYDGHGSTRQLVTGTSVASQYNYDAYGETLGTSTSTSGTSLRYCGEQFDDDLQMYNLRARFYDPSNGRFNALDSFVGNNEDPQSLHKYAYCHSDPINGIDPTGRSLIQQMAVVGIISGLVTALVFGIDSALGGKDTKNILFDAGTGFLVGFTVGALLTLIGPAAFLKIAPYVPYLLLLLGGAGAYDSFSNGMIAQGVFRILVTVLSVGMASAAARAKIMQFARYLWVKVFPPSTAFPTLAGNLPNSGQARILYNPQTKQIWVSQASTHAGAAVEAGWTADDLGNLLVGGHAAFENGVIKQIIWSSGFYPGTAALQAEAAAAASLANAPAIIMTPPISSSESENDL